MFVEAYIVITGLLNSLCRKYVCIQIYTFDCIVTRTDSLTTFRIGYIQLMVQALTLEGIHHQINADRCVHGYSYVYLYGDISNASLK